MTRRKFLKSVVAGTAIVAAGIEIPAIAAPPAKRKPFDLGAFASLSGCNVAFQSGIALFLSNITGTKNKAGGWDVTFGFFSEFTYYWNPERYSDGTPKISRKFPPCKTVDAARLIPIIQSADSVLIDFEGTTLGAMKFPSKGDYVYPVWLCDHNKGIIYPLCPWGAFQASPIRYTTRNDGTRYSDEEIEDAKKNGKFEVILCL